MGKDAMNSINRSRHENIVHIRVIPCEVSIVSFRAKGTKVHDYYNVAEAFQCRLLEGNAKYDASLNPCVCWKLGQ